MIQIDGSEGEGGGQILRTALSLAALTGTPFRMDNIRAGRARPGLMRQHLTAAEAARSVSNGVLDGAEIGARTLTFRPGPVRGGDFALAIGTAGSTTLVLQTLLPCLLAATEPSRVTLTGGTHNPMCPTFDFLAHAFMPALRAMGADVALTLVRPGFAPAGGGELIVTVTPGPLRPVAFTTRGAVRAVEVVATIADLAENIAHREATTAAAALADYGATWRIERHRDCGPGNVLSIFVHTGALGRDAATEVVTAIGQRGIRAEDVAAAAANEARAYLEGGAPIGPHLADQLILPMALAGGGAFVTSEPTQHTLTQIETVRRFLPVPITCTPIAPVAPSGAAFPNGIAGVPPAHAPREREAHASTGPMHWRIAVGSHC